MISLTTIPLFCCVLIISGAVGQNNDVCLTLPGNPNNANPQTIQGVPGKRGPVGGVGSKGVQGQKGEPGDVESCGCIPGDVIMLKEQVRVLYEMIQMLNLTLQQQEEPHKTSDPKINRNDTCLGGLIYDNQCIRMPSSTQNYYNFTQAQQFCNNLNATLLEISSDAMYNKVYKYVFGKLKQIEGTKILKKYFWLGSTFEPLNNPNNLVTLTNGTKVRLTKWYIGGFGFPLKGSTNKARVNLLIAVNSQVGSNNQDLWNYIPTARVGLPLCSYNI